MMLTESLCMGCLADTKGADVCPICGYRNHTPAESSVQLPPRTILNGRYLLGRVLGQGGFGITYLGYDLELQRKLAIKEYFPLEISTRSREMTVTPLSGRYGSVLDYGLQKFGEEANALGRFKDHPGVVSILDFFHSNGTAYIVTAYLEGATLTQYLSQRGGRIPLDDALTILSPVMDALADLHSAGLLHRDISPDNIFLDANGGARILDFGATRHSLGEQMHSLSVVLKPGYTPEEQYRSRGKQGPWTDVYSVAATLYRCITGRVPTEAFERLQADDLIPPSRLGVTLPSSSEQALLRGLSIQAADRYQTLPEFQQAIVADQAHPHTWWERILELLK